MSIPLYIAVNPSVRETLPEFIAYAQANPPR